MTEPSAHVSTYALDGLREGRLDAARAREVEAHLATCETCRAREAELRAHQRQFTDDVLPRTRASLHQRAEAISKRPRRAWLAGLVLAPVAALVLLFARPAREPVTDPYVGEKGAAAGSWLRVVAQRKGKVFAVKDGSTLAAGDAIRFAVRTASPYLMIASVDGQGQAKIYVPFEGQASASVTPDTPLELPADASIELDAAPGPERIYALGSKRALAAPAVLAALAALGAGGADAIRARRQLPVEAEDQMTILLEKAPAR